MKVLDDKYYDTAKEANDVAVTIPACIYCDPDKGWFVVEPLTGEERQAAILKAEMKGDPNCPRCGGRGYISGYEHIQGGRCFRCN